MARHYNLNKLRLEVDDDGFRLSDIPGDNKVVILGDFNSPESITVRFLRNDVIDSYISQPEVLDYVRRGDPDALNPEKTVVETQFILAPGSNWFELDHSFFNEVYCDSEV